MYLSLKSVVTVQQQLEQLKTKNSFSSHNVVYVFQPDNKHLGDYDKW